MIRYLLTILPLLSSAATAGVVVKGLPNLSENDKREVFRTLIKRKHDLEKSDEINADLKKSLPGKNVEAYWVPDTLYQTVQAYFDVEGIGDYHEGMIKHLKSGTTPQVWKKMKEEKAFLMHGTFPTRLEDFENSTPSIVKDWARFNEEIDKRLKQFGYSVNNPHTVLDRIIEEGDKFNRLEKRITPSDLRKQKEHLKKNVNFLKHALTVEVEAHKAGKLLLWRYAQALPNNIPDLPYEIKPGDIHVTLKSPLKFHAAVADRISYANRLLEGYFGDGVISEQPYSRFTAPACTFSFLANDLSIMGKGQKIKDAIVYSLAVNPEELHDLYEKSYLYYPRAHMPQHSGLYGAGEAFHASWLLNTQDPENTKKWLSLMSSDALQVHYINNAIQEDFKGNADTARLKKIYADFLELTSKQSLVKRLGIEWTPNVQSVQDQGNGAFKITTKMNQNADYQAESKRIPVTPGQKIAVKYKVNVIDGVISLGFLKTNRGGWYGKELILDKVGLHEGIYECEVPEGEKLTSLVLRDYHLPNNPGNSTFVVQDLDILEEANAKTSFVERLDMKWTPNVQSREDQGNGAIKVKTKANQSADYQAESKRINVTPGHKIRVKYKLNVMKGVISLGFLNTNRNGWYGNELLLKEGSHEGVYESEVPPGEKVTSLVLRDYHLPDNPGDSTFVVEDLEFDDK